MKKAFEECGILQSKANGAKQENLDYVLYKVNERILNKLTTLEGHHNELTQELISLNSN